MRQISFTSAVSVYSAGRVLISSGTLLGQELAVFEVVLNGAVLDDDQAL